MVFRGGDKSERKKEKKGRKSGVKKTFEKSPHA